MSSVIQFNFQAGISEPQAEIVAAEPRMYNGLISTIYNLPASQDVLCDIQFLEARQRKLYLLPASVHYRADFRVSAPLHLGFTLMSNPHAKKVFKDTRGALHHVHGVIGRIDAPVIRY